MLVAALGFAVMGVFVKIAKRLPAWEVVFFRSLVNVAWLLPWATKQPLHAMWKKEPRALLMRGVCGTLSMACYYYAIEHLQLAEAAMLNHCAPILVLIISALFLGERLSLPVTAFIATAFAGVALILKPDFATSDRLAGFVGLTSAVLAAIAYISVRVATRSVHPTFIVFSFAAVATLVSAPLAATTFTTPTPVEWIALLACGTAASIAQSAMTLGYSKLPASVASPLLLSSVVFAAIFAWIFWDEIPDRWAVLGGALIAIGLTGAHRYRLKQQLKPVIAS